MSRRQNIKTNLLLINPDDPVQPENNFCQQVYLVFTFGVCIFCIYFNSVGLNGENIADGTIYNLLIFPEFC
jgi:hypothetical protein